MPALMFDSDNPAALLGGQAAGCRILSYADLATPQLVSLGAGRLGWIDRGLGDPMGLATIADIEPGALSVASGAARCKQWLAEGRHYVTAYHDRNDADAVTTALAGAAVYRWWATLDGTLRPGPGRVDAVQFAGAAELGFHADVSAVWNDAFRPLPAGASATAVAAVKAALNVSLSAEAGLERAIAALLDAVRPANLSMHRVRPADKQAGRPGR